MDPERFGLVARVFERAVGLEPEARARYLDEACAGDARLRLEVERLITADTGAAAALDGVLAGAVGTLDVPVSAGRRIGAYEVVSVLGRGGMGTVHLAVRADDAYHKQVAIKRLRSGPATPEILVRFRSERQILASLDHPNIARLLDGGTDEEGHPFFVMEYVAGEPIDAYCDRLHLSVRRRLELFEKVCAAVQYAHQNLVVHRDLKPANILVTPDGTPKLLDFGIAKLLDPTSVPHTVAETGTAERLMTPQYASPEQVRGETVTTSSDVYALGVVLYQLLAGHLPYRIITWTASEIERKVCETEPEPPSAAVARVEERPGRDGGAPLRIAPGDVSRDRATDPDRLRRSLAGDLDNIVLTCLRKEPARRYASAGQLAEEIRRHLDGLPVIARGDTWSYRAGKFVRRHRFGVATAAVAIVTLLAFGVTMAVQAARIARQRDAARLERQRAERVTEFLVDLFDVSDPSEARGRSVTAKEILDRGADRIRGELRDAPKLRGTLLGTIARVYTKLGLFDRAEGLAREAVAIRRQDPDDDAALARSLQTLAAVLEGEARYDEADKLLRESIALDRAHAESRASELGGSLNQLGRMLSTLGRYDEARTALGEALELATRAHGPDAPETLTVQDSLANLLSFSGDLAGAESLLRKTLEATIRIHGRDHPDVVHAMNNLGQVLHLELKNEEAEKLLREALEINRKVQGEHPDVAISLNNLSLLLIDLGKLDDAEKLQKEALAMRERLLGPGHPDVANSLHNLAFLYQVEKRYDEAVPLYERAIEIQRKTLGPDSPDLAVAVKNLAAVEQKRGNLARAETLFAEAAAIHDRLGGDVGAAASYIQYAELLVIRGKCSAAVPQFEKGIAAWNAMAPTEAWVAEAESLLGGCLLDLGKPGQAEPHLAAAHAFLLEDKGADDPRTRAAAERLAKLGPAARDATR